MSKQDVMDYVLNSPHNTNPMVLASLMSNLGGGEPVVLYPNSADYYLEDPTYGDAVLDAITTGKQILIRVPNADDQGHTAIYSPVLMYQLPNHSHSFVYLFYLKDDKQDLSSLVPGMQLPTYGELKLKVSKVYEMSPLEKDRIPLVEKAKITYVEGSAPNCRFSINYKTMSYDPNRTYLIVIETDRGILSQYGIVESYTLMSAAFDNGRYYSFYTDGSINGSHQDLKSVSIYEIIN